MRRVRRIAALLGVLVVVGACQVVAGIERVAKVDPKIEGGALADGPAADTGIPSNDPCKHALAPDLPPIDDDPQNSIPPFWLAVRTLSLSSPNGEAIGIDLDKVCTCDKRAGTAHDGTSSCTPDPKHDDCDEGDGGIDNRAAALFKAYEVDGGLNIGTDATEDIASGNRTLLIHISEWNGKANDREVRVGMVLSSGMSDESQQPGCNGDPTRPGWCGQDPWNYPPNTVRPDTHFPTVGRGVAWIVNHQLVFNSSSGSPPITMFFGKATLELGSPVTLGTLVQKDGHWAIENGVLAGRIAITELLAALGQANNPEDGGKKTFCDSPYFKIVRPELCRGVDIGKTQVEDFQGNACNAVSTAIAFTAEEAILGAEVPDKHQDESPCSPARLTDKTLYTCP